MQNEYNVYAYTIIIVSNAKCIQITQPIRAVHAPSIL